MIDRKVCAASAHQCRLSRVFVRVFFSTWLHRCIPLLIITVRVCVSLREPHEGGRTATVRMSVTTGSATHAARHRTRRSAGRAATCR